MSAGTTKLGRFQMPQVGDTLEGRYEITKMLATGGMGVILRARHVRMGRDVAIKILHPHIAQEDDVIARFEREVRLAQMLNHPNTIRLYDFGEAENGLIYVVMELLEGADLKEIIAQEGPLTVGRAVDLAMQVLDGLGEAHEQDFVHRDLKPSNVFITQDRRGNDQVKILDFGIAKSLEEGGSDLTATGSICGTAAYVAPEYLHDPTPQKAADVYAVGLILLEMLTGKRAFHGTTTAQTLMMQMQREIQVPRQIASTPLGDVIACAAHKEPARRYQNADQMYRALEAIVDQLPADMRLRPQQVGELLRPPTGSMPGMNPGRIPPDRQDSSTGLPQANHTPATGEHSSPAMSNSAPADATLDQTIEAMDGDQTLVTPFPSPMGSSQELPLRAPDYTQPGATKPLTGASNKGTPVVWIGAAAVVLLAGAVAAFLLTSGSDPEASTPEAVAQDEPRVAEAASPADDEPSEPAKEASTAAEPAEEPAPAPAGPIEFHIESSPKGASVMAGDEELGTTPLEHSIAPDDLPLTLRIAKDGFQEASVELTDESDTSQQVMLVELAKPAPQPRVEERPRKPAKRAPRRRDKPADKPKPKEGEENVDEFLDEYL